MPLRSWRAVFDIESAQRLSQCGIGMVDSPVEVIRLMLLYLGKPIETPSAQDLAHAPTLGYANANLAANPFVEPAILADPSVYFPAEVQKRLIAETEETAEQARSFTRIWQKFKTGQ